MPIKFRTLVAAVGATAVATGAMAATERSFLKKALEGDNSEMALGQMAATNGDSEGIRSFGRMLHDDHSASKQQALIVAKAHGLDDTDEMAPEAKDIRIDN